MNVQIIQVPYDSGHKGVRTGQGPNHFIEHGIDQILRDCGHDVYVCQIESTVSLPTEIGTGFELNRLLAECVRTAATNDRFPLVLAGNCNSCVGTIAGINSSRLGIVWFDAHGDFNTPDTTLTGFLDGMGLAMATGRGWRSLLNSIPGFQPIPANRIVHVGARDLDAAEKKLLVSANISLLTPFGKSETEILDELSEVLLQLKKRVDGV